MKHYASPSFWKAFQELPPETQELARSKFELLKENQSHPSLHLKRTGAFTSVRVDLRYRALATETKEGLIWFWIGNHKNYERLIMKRR